MISRGVKTVPTLYFDFYSFSQVFLKLNKLENSQTVLLLDTDFKGVQRVYSSLIMIAYSAVLLQSECLLVKMWEQVVFSFKTKSFSTGWYLLLDKEEFKPIPEVVKT